MIELAIVFLNSLNIRMLPYGSINKRCLRRLPRRKICQKRMPMRWHLPARFNDDESLMPQAQQQRRPTVAAPRHLLLFEHVHGESRDRGQATRWTCWRSTSSTACS